MRFCIARRLLSLPSTHIGRGRMWWAVQGIHLAFFLQDPPKTCVIRVFLECPRRLLWKCGTKWRSLICSLLLPNFNITSGHSHFAYLPPQRHHSLETIGGERPEDYKQVYVAIHQVTCWIGEFCRELIAFVALFQSTTTHISPPSTID